jgi:hypothetical protein
MTEVGGVPPAPVVTPVVPSGRRPSWQVLLGLITTVLVVLVGIALVGQSGGRPGQQAAGGGLTASPVATAPQAPSATPLVSSSPPQPAQVPPATLAATWREMPSTEEVIAAAELVDPMGDVSWRLESGPATQPPGTPNIDVSRIVGWIAGETLFAEVTLEGQMPKPPDRTPALRLRVGAGDRFAFEAPIVCRPLCEQWGTFFEVPAFTYRVKQLPSQWVATFAVDLASLGTTGTTEYHVDVSAEAYPADYASDWYDEAGPLVVKRSS